MMDLGYENPLLGALIRAQLPQTLDEFAAHCQAWLSDLITLHPKFGELSFVRAGDPNRPTALEKDLSNLRDWLLCEAWDPKTRNSYTARDANGNPTSSSTGWFRLGLSNWRGFDHKLDISISWGPLIRGVCEGSCSIVMPRKDHPEFTQGPLPLQLLETVVKHWPIRYADFTTLGLLKKVNHSGPRQSWVGTINVGWLTYIDDPSVAECLPSDTPAHRLGRGLVFKLGERMPDYDNGEHVARAAVVREALRTAGKLSVDRPLHEASKRDGHQCGRWPSKAGCAP